MNSTYRRSFVKGEKLKYFTREWWASGGEDQSCVSAYSAYIASIKPKLSSGLARLANGHLLHDASLSRIINTVDEKQLKMYFVGWDEVFENKKQIELCFDGVIRLNIDFPNDQDGGEGGMGDLGYYEIEMQKAGLFEARMLFSSSAEMQVIFRNVTVKSRKSKTTLQ